MHCTAEHKTREIGKLAHFIFKIIHMDLFNVDDFGTTDKCYRAEDRFRKFLHDVRCFLIKNRSMDQIDENRPAKLLVLLASPVSCGSRHSGTVQLRMTFPDRKEDMRRRAA